MWRGYIIDTLISVDFQEIVKIWGRIIEFYEGVIYREYFKKSPFREVMDKLFALGQKYKDENKEVMQLLVKFLMNRLCGEQIRKDIEEKFACKSDYWMISEHDEKVKDYWKKSQGIYIGKKIDDAGLEDGVKKIKHHATSIRSFCIE